MKLKKNEKQLPDAPRSTIATAARSSGSPGQRILAIVAAVGGVTIILGAMGYKYIWPIYTGNTQAVVEKKKKDEQEAAAAADNFAKPELNASLSLGGDADSQQQPPASGYSDKGAPPGLIGGGNGQGQAGGNQQQQQGNQQAPNVDQAKIAADARRFQGSLDGFGNGSGLGNVGGAGSGAGGSGAGYGQQGTAPVPGATFAGTFNDQAARQGTGNGAGAAQQQNPTVLNGMLQGTSLADANAKYIPNQHLTLAKGTNISCILDTAISTDQPGFVQCTTDYPVSSMDGKVVLMERGTIFFGEITKAMENGKKSVFVNWTSGRTPMGVDVPLASPGTDALGRAGISGEVDDHFWQKLKGALLFSSLEDTAQIITSRATNNATGSSNVILLPNTQGAAQSAIGELVKQGSDMKPTLYKNQGAAIAITAARNIDFSSQYRLVARGNMGGNNE